MRALAIGVALSIAALSAPWLAPASAQTKAAGNLIQVMRGSLFRDANIIFDVQQADPGAPLAAHDANINASTTSMFSRVYPGWQTVENAAVMLDEAVDVMLKPRLCANGIPAPVSQADYKRTAEGLRTVARDILTAAQARNRDKVIELTDALSEACAACHQIYRDPEGPKGFGDTSIRCKVPPPTR